MEIIKDKKKKSFILNVLIFTAIILIIAVSSDTVIRANSKNSIEKYQSVFIDNEGLFDIDQIIEHQKILPFIDYNESGVSSTISDASYWIRIPLKKFPIAEGKKLLELSKPHLSKVSFFQVSAHGEIVKSLETGRNEAFSSRDINYRQFLFEIDDSYASGYIYIMIKTESYLQAPTRLWTYSDFISTSNERSLVLGLFYGSLIIMILYNAFLAYSLKDIRYVFYVLFVLSFTILQAVWDGYSLQYIWPELYTLDTKSNPFLIALCAIWLMAFNYSFFEIKSRARKLLFLYKLFFSTALLVLLLTTFIAMKAAVYMATIIVFCAFILSLFSFIKSIPKNKSHYIYITAWSVFFYMAIISSLGGFNLIPYSILSVHGVKIGVLILVLLFSLSLSYKIKEIDYMRTVEIEKGLLLRKLHQVNQKITSTRDFELLYSNMLDGYSLFLSFKAMIVAIEGKNKSFKINVDNQTTHKLFCEDSYNEYKSLSLSDIVRPSKSFLSKLSYENIDNALILPIESITSRQGFVLFLLEDNYYVSDQVRKLISDYTYQISLAMENIELVEELKEAAEKDSLTKLYNRKYFFEEGNRMLNELSDELISIVMIDIDHFKSINDNHGHIIGDKTLLHLSNKMKQYFSKDTLIARYGGEEFIMIIKSNTKYETFELIDDFRMQIERQSIEINRSLSVNITLSSGIATYIAGNTIDDLVERADNLLYEAKESGRNKVMIE